MKSNSKNLTLKQVEKLYVDSALYELGKSDLIGFIGNTPVYKNPLCPPGVIYMLDDSFFKTKKKKVK